MPKNEQQRLPWEPINDFSQSGAEISLQWTIRSSKQQSKSILSVFKCKSEKSGNYLTAVF